MHEAKRGVHCQPDSVVASPDYAKRLVEEGGVDCFILRTGYSLDIPQSMEEAVAIVRAAKVKLSFLMGSWWGGAIAYPENLPSKSWESKYPMDMPGSAIDEGIVDKLQKLCGAYKPDAICMTHARYRHPGYVEGVLDEGSGDTAYQARMEAAGIPRTDMLAARAAWEKALGKADKATLLKASEGGLVSFLCALAQDNAFRRLVAFRNATVHSAFRTFREAVTAFGVSFGSNAYSPLAAEVCGHDYGAVFADTCDFVQPLLPFLEYHRYEPLAAWARYILQHAKVDEATAIALAQNLFSLGDVKCPESLRAFDTCEEGSGEMIRAIVGKELQMCKTLTADPSKLQPVFRGKGWDWAVTDGLIADAQAMGIDAFAFMGCEYLLKDPSATPADYQYALTDPSPGDGWF